MKKKTEERLVVGLFKGPDGFRLDGEPSILIDSAKETFQSAAITIVARLLQARQAVIDCFPSEEPPKKRKYVRKVTPVLCQD